MLSAATPLAAQTPVAADTPAQTAAGVSYTVPRDWSASANGQVVSVASPGNELRLALVDVGAAADAQAATARAWTLYDPAANRTVRLVTPAPAREGWEERVAISYETSPDERKVVQALAMRRGTTWTVLIIDGAESAFARRSAAASLLQQSLRPAGYARESFAGRTAHRLTPERIALLRSFMAEAMEKLGVPGAGIALIENGRVVWEGGVGVRRIGHPEPVTAHTKFMIASNTKGMATLLLSVLADEGRLRWDQPVTELYPSFRLGDDATTRATLVRHLVCACTGLPRKDFAFILSEPNAPATETFRMLSLTQPTSGFGELFQYNNLMASAAGYLGGSLAYPGMELGAAFDRAMENRIFRPLGMRDTTFSFAEGMRGDWAPPHGLDLEGRTVEMSNRFNETVIPHRPAGGAWSTAADMARYVQLELSRGLTPEGRRLVSEANILERRRRGVSVGEDSWYGMGLFEQISYGVPVVTHGGTLLGYRSNFWVLPEAGVGAVVLTNADDGAALLAPFFRRLLEVLYDGRPEAMGDVDAAAARIQAQVAARRARLTVPGDPSVLAGLAASYRNPEVGGLTIRRQNGQTWLRAGVIDAPVATRRNPDGSVSLVTVGPGAIGLETLVGRGPDGRTLTVRDSQHEYVYAETR
jgi:CubicO group peptidase (beta-lactamase class C family)